MKKWNSEKFGKISKNMCIVSGTIPHSSSGELSTMGGNSNAGGDGADNIDLLSQDIDRLTVLLSTVENKSDPPEITNVVNRFTNIIESKLANSGEIRNGRGKTTMEDDDLPFIDAVKRLSKLEDAFAEFPPTSSLNRTSTVLHHAMAFFEEEFRYLLEDSRNASHSRVTKQSSFNFIKLDETDRDRGASEPSGEDEYPSYPQDALTKMNRIATAMISAGYETECCQVYSIARRNSFSEEMKRLEFEKMNMDDVQRMSWELLEEEITRWIRIVKICSNSLLPAEQKLSDSIFIDHPLISRTLFSNLARAVVFQLLDFAEAVSMTKRAAEKLFKFLDMFETIHELIPVISDSCSNECQHELKSEIVAAGERLGEAAVNIFCDLESSIRNDTARTAVPGGAVHPLTRYVMNYLKYASEYKETLEQIFQQHGKLDQPLLPSSINVDIDTGSPDTLGTPGKTTPFSIQLITIMDLLDANLEAKSKLYRDPALRSIFLMNNGRYILQKVKGSTEIHHVMGDTWCRRKSTVVRQFHKNYQRETWGKVLHILSHEGLQGNAKAVKSVLKERFKSFSNIFDEIHRTQSTWVVSDEQLQSELQVSISAVIIPAYRSFLGRFRQYFDNTKQAEKYIKYQPEDIETLIEGLFVGNIASMARRR